MKLIFALLLAASALDAAFVPAYSSSQQNVASMERKLQHIERNGAAAKPDSTPTDLTEEEVNAYFAAGRVRLPDGVQSLRFRGQAGVVTGTARVDFDKVKAGRSSSNPLLSLFSGVHDVEVIAHAHGAGGTVRVQVTSVALDGVEIPRFVLELFVEKYIQPKHPELGLDSRFALPDKIDTATVGEHKLSLVQR
jgi:hypothetical protein